MTKEEFFENAKLVNRYKVIKKLDGELSYAEIGSVYHSDILYDRGYNILQLVTDGFLEVVERIFPFEKDIVGKNKHSVLTVCPECGSHGVNMPLEKQCGNCNYTETRTYYDAETIHNYMQSVAASLPQSSKTFYCWHKEATGEDTCKQQCKDCSGCKGSEEISNMAPQSSTEEEKELWDDIIQYLEIDGYTDLLESDAKKIISDFISTYKISKR